MQASDRIYDKEIQIFNDFILTCYFRQPKRSKPYSDVRHFLFDACSAFCQVLWLEMSGRFYVLPLGHPLSYHFVVGLGIFSLISSKESHYILGIEICNAFGVY